MYYSSNKNKNTNADTFTTFVTNTRHNDRVVKHYPQAVKIENLEAEDYECKATCGCCTETRTLSAGTRWRVDEVLSLSQLRQTLGWHARVRGHNMMPFTK